ncbi:STAS domain-containing protein [Actinomadura sp. NPDC048394]|uniref:STAS domain-containing protein n=1 Tax=Actinomadura sp. NPDC048394 TaxID=3158223 RepID=UPI0033F2D944
MKPLETACAVRGAFAVIRLAGELDYSTVHLAETTVNRAFAGPTPHLIFDLSGLTLMDSSGVALLLQTYKTLRERHGTIALAGPSPSIQRTASITGVTKLMPVFATVDEAASIAPVALPPSASAAESESTDRSL